MSCFDTVIIRCPKCKDKISYQSKAADCNLETFSYQQVPLRIAGDLNEEEFQCRCGADFKLVCPVSYIRMEIVDID